MKKNVDENELVQYYVVNKDLNMSIGKTSAQVAHVATIIAIEEGTSIKPEIYTKFDEWYADNQTKIILGAHQKDLEKLVSEGFYYIRDNGKTEIEPNSLTVVGLGVMTRKEAKLYIKRFQLL
ncbi:aminoacyl-tRNA hydrolase [Clostridium sp. MT-14]|uniref:aminoacyl-tRNA hydrolase n=1 Tax=Clostridium sp. MT-14 TaxID=3348360 RepID=UPI0035F4886D